MSRILSLLVSDMRNIGRDSILAFILFTPLVAAMGARWCLLYISQFLQHEFGFDLSDYYVLIMSVLIMTTPMMFGFITGFLLLDERDEQIINYISITPLAKKGYLLYRILFPIIASFLLSFVVLEISGLASYDRLKMIPIALMCSLEAPILALILIAFASNKVEGLALFKGVNMMYAVGPGAGFFIQSKWHLAFGVLPPYWVTQAFVASYDSIYTYILYMTGGLAVHLVCIALLITKFSTKVD